jgi:hypothetical protein
MEEKPFAMALKRREKFFILLAFIAFAIFLFDLLYYAPQSRKVVTLKEAVNAADLKLDELGLLSRGIETAEAEIARLEAELKGLNERTLKGEEFRAFLRHLAGESDPLQMKVISLIPSEEKILPPGEPKRTVPQESKRVTVQMVLHSTFSKLEAYLKGIEELPFLVRVDGLQIERVDEIRPLLKVTVELKMVIVSL